LKNQDGEDKDYVLDSSAFLTLFEDEKGAETVQELLERAKKEEVVIFVCFATFAEVFYITFREQGQEEAQKRVKLMSRLAITRVESSEELGLIAGRLKATHKLSFADAWIAATAVLYDSTLVHKDPEFEQLEDEVKVLKLPYKLI
jgi:predicted nucleic acid-binding protein